MKTLTQKLKGKNSKMNTIMGGRPRSKKKIEQAIRSMDKIRKKIGKFNASEIIREWRDKRYGKDYFNKEKEC